MKHVWSILCKKASIDSQTNSLSIFDVIDKLTITQNSPTPMEVPIEFVMPLEFQLVTFVHGVKKSKNKPVIKITLLNAGNEIVGETENVLEIPANAGSLRSIIAFDAIKIKGEGMYTFKVRLKESSKESYSDVADIPLEVEIIKPSIKN